MKSDGPCCTGAQIRGFITSPCLKLSEFRKSKAENKWLVERRLLCSSRTFYMKSYEGSGSIHSALQQGERHSRAQERAFRNSREADGHHRQRRFTLPLVASGWCAPPRTPRSFQTLPAGFEVSQIQAQSQMCCSLINFRLTFYLRLRSVVLLSSAL